MATLQYSSSKHDSVVLIKIGGSLDAENAPRFAKKMEEEIGRGAYRIVCSMPQLDYIASAGLGVLISINETLNARGGGLKLSSLNPKIQKIFKLLGFTSIFKIYETDGEAMDSF